MSKRYGVVFLLFLATTCLAATSVPVGSLTAVGQARVSGVVVPDGATVFSGDTIETQAANAVFTFSRGDSITLRPNSSVRVASTQAVELLKGVSRVQARTKGLTLVAANWTLHTELDVKTGRVMADVLRGEDGTVSLNVTEGQVVAKTAGGKFTTMVAAGRPTVLPAAALPPPPQGGPQAGAKSGTDVKTVGAYVVGVAGIALGVAAIATRKDYSDDINSARSLAQQAQTAAQQAQTAAQAAQTLAQQLSAQITTLQAQVKSLQSYAATLQTALNSLIASGAQQQQLLAQLSATIAELQAAQQSLSAAQAEINALVAKLAAGQALTPQEQQRLTALQTQQQQLSATIGNLTTQTLSIANAIGGLPRLPPPVPSPT